MSGPEFLGVYAAAFAVAGIAAALLKAGFRKRRDTDPAAGTGPADVYTLAVVGGGTARVVDTAVQALVETGRLRAGRDHRISPAGAPVAHEPVQQAVLGCFDSPAGITLSTARTRAAASGPVQQVAQDAVRRGLLFGAGHRKAALASALPLAAVFCVGVARLVNGVHLGRPVGLLVMALLLSGGITVAVALNAPRRTLAGDRLLERARQGRVPDPRLFGSYGIASYAPSGGNDMLVPAAVLGVAVLGAAGVADPDLRQALYGGMSGSGSGSTDSGSGDSGGGGCGGGGCGGGCGGCGG